LDDIFWDGDNLLLDDRGGTSGLFNLYLDDFAVADMTNGTLTSIDRDFAGTAVAQHTQTTSTNWQTLGMYGSRAESCANRAQWAAGGGPAAAFEPYLVMPRTDGISDGYATFQGARTYDNNAGQWTAPDAYAGNVEDPAAQRAYMWNNNNPYRYEDPSGYDPLQFGIFWQPGVGLQIRDAAVYANITHSLPFNEENALGGTDIGKSVGSLGASVAGDLGLSEYPIAGIVASGFIETAGGELGGSVGNFLGGYGFLGEVRPSSTLSEFTEDYTSISGYKGFLDAGAAIGEHADKISQGIDISRDAIEEMIKALPAQKPTH
jgi:hypothetical protein